MRIQTTILISSVFILLSGCGGRFGKPLTVDIPQSTATEGDAPVTGSIRIVIVPQEDLVISLASDDISEATVPTTVTILAGTTSVNFDITVVNDTDADGAQIVTITASATGHSNGSDTITIQDDDLPTLTVVISRDSATEGDCPVLAMVSVDVPPSSDLTVDLVSDDESEATVPLTVTIFADATSASFDIVVVDDTDVDGPQTVTITASATGHSSGSDNITIQDDDLPTLTVVISADSATEGDAPVPATVSVNVPPSSDLTVDLISNDESEATVPATVTILGGETSATFDVTIIDDIDVDADETVTVTASASGHNSGQDIILVMNDDFGPAIALSPTLLEFSATEGGPNPVSQPVSITNTGGVGTTLSWTVFADKPWIQVSPTYGTTITGPDTFDVSAVAAQSEAWRSVATSGAPEKRKSCAVAWTGKHVIVWGGAGGGGTGDTALNSGGIYDPVTNTWVGQTTMNGAPAPRSDCSTVWTGSEMMIWGGQSETNGRFADGACYDPASDTWRLFSGMNATARASHGAVWLGSRMLVWGGDIDSGKCNTGEFYDPATNSWSGTTSTVGVPSVRSNPVVVWTGSEVIVWGGAAPDWGKLNDGAIYDPVTDTWLRSTSLTNAPAPRRNPTGVWTGSELIVWSGDFLGWNFTNTGGRYNPVTDSWVATTTSGAPSARDCADAAWTGTEMFAWGGYGSGLRNDGGLYRPPINLSPDTYTGTITVSDPNASNSPQTVDVSLTVSDSGPSVGLVAHWKLDENSGTTATDSSGNGNDGTVWAWGYNSYGQLGDGTTTDSPTPVQVLGP